MKDILVFGAGGERNYVMGICGCWGSGVKGFIGWVSVLGPGVKGICRLVSVSIGARGEGGYGMGVYVYWG